MSIRSSIRKYCWSVLFIIPALLLWKIHPSAISNIPICSFKRMTGFNCPGCGATRATHYLLNGDISTALQHNAAFVSLIPLALLGVVYVLWQRTKRNVPALPIIATLIILGIFLSIFGIVRNLPGYEWLNPPLF